MVVYAIPGADGAPVELVAGRGFTSYFIRVETDEEAAWSFMPIGAVAGFEVNHAAGSLEGLSDEDRGHFLIQAVTVAEPPPGKVETSHSIGRAEDGSFTYEAGFEDPAPTPVPAVVTRVQGRVQLLRDGRLAATTAAVASASAEVQEYWASTAIFRRDNGVLAAMWAALGWSEADLDATFRAAAQIET